MSDWPPPSLRTSSGQWVLAQENLLRMPARCGYDISDLCAMAVEHQGTQIKLESLKIPVMELEGEWVPVADQPLSASDCFRMALLVMEEPQRYQWVKTGQISCPVPGQFQLQGKVSGTGIQVVLTRAAAALAPRVTRSNFLENKTASLAPPPAFTPEAPSKADAWPTQPDFPAPVNPHALPPPPAEPPPPPPRKSPPLFLLASPNGRHYACVGENEITLWSGNPPQLQSRLAAQGAARDAFLSDEGELYLRLDTGVFQAGGDWMEIGPLGPLARKEGSAHLGRLAWRSDGQQLIFERIQPIFSAATRLGRRRNARMSGHQLLLLDLTSGKQRAFFGAEAETGHDDQVRWSASRGFAFLAAVQPAGGSHQLDLIDLSQQTIKARFELGEHAPESVHVNDSGTLLVTGPSWTLARLTPNGAETYPVHPPSGDGAVLLAADHIATQRGNHIHLLSFDGTSLKRSPALPDGYEKLSLSLDDRSTVRLLGWRQGRLELVDPWSESRQRFEPSAPPAAPRQADSFQAPPAAEVPARKPQPTVEVDLPAPQFPLAELLSFMTTHRVERAFVQDGQPVMLQRGGKRIPWNTYVPARLEVARWILREQRELGDPELEEFDACLGQSEFRVLIRGMDSVEIVPT